MKIITIGIFILASTFRTGDNNQVDGVLRTLQDFYKSKRNVVLYHNKFEKSDDLIQEYIKSDNDVNFIMGVGRVGIKELLKIQNSYLHKGALYVWLGHQAMDGMMKLSPDTIIGIPKYAISEKIANRFSNIIPMVGVANNITNKKLLDAFNRHPKVNKNKDPITLVILPGDAPDRTGKQKLYTDTDAILLARYIISQIKTKALPSKVLITNGPRTGKHNKKTKQISSVHGKNIKDKSIKISLDYVTAAFCEQLKQSDVDYELYNFDFRFLPSAYYALLGCAYLNIGSKIFVPGASSSMLSEISDIFSMEQYVIIEGSNMSVVHYRDVGIRFFMGAKVLKQVENNLELTSNKSKEKTQKYKTGALSVAEYLATRIKQLSV